jgi:hypothetical protein
MGALESSIRARRSAPLLAGRRIEPVTKFVTTASGLIVFLLEEKETVEQWSEGGGALLSAARVTP